MFRRTPCLSLFLVLALALAACTKQTALNVDYPMGERVTIGPLTYNVVEAVWRSQLGDAFKVRVPEQRFFLLTISVTNGGGKEISVPLLTLQDQKGQNFLESSDGEGVTEWFGLLRNLAPAQTQQGRILFDVPLTSYRLRLTDGNDTGAEKYGWVEIPLRIDTDAGLETPAPGTLK